MTNAEKAAQALERRKLVRELRRGGMTWRDIGDVLGCSYQRARQIHGPARVAVKPRVEWAGTIASYVESRAQAVRDVADATLAQLGAT